MSMRGDFDNGSPPPSYYEPPSSPSFYCALCGVFGDDYGTDDGLCADCDQYEPPCIRSECDDPADGVDGKCTFHSADDLDAVAHLGDKTTTDLQSGG